MNPFAIAPGDVVGGTYEVRSLIGRGAMGQVFEAFDLSLRRTVAIKMLLDARGHLRLEGQALAAIRHPGLMKIFGMGRHRGAEYLVLEHLVGVTLEEELDRRRAAGQRLSVSESVDILVSLSDVLGALHAAGVAHRDVKPGNIMLCGERLVLIDLGLVMPEVDMGRLKECVGTPHYIAPEAVRGGLCPGIGALSDIYALGVIAYELVAGRLPFEGLGVTQVLLSHTTAPVPDLGTVVNVPSRLAALVRDCMAKDPGDRPVSADAVRLELSLIRDTLAAESTERLRVVIVEDDADLAALIGAYVEQVLRNADIEIAIDGLDALGRIARVRPHLIVADLRMPRMNGVELCMYLRGQQLLQHPTIVAVSSEASEHDIELLYSLGVSEFLTKGAGLVKRLRPILERLVGNRQLRPHSRLRLSAAA